MHFQRTSLALAAFLFIAGLNSTAASGELKLGMQTWTLRNLSFEDSVEFCAKHQIKYLQLIPNHLDVNASKEEWQKKKDFIEKKGLVAYTFGVAGTSMKHEENKKLFECAKFMGMKLIVVEPSDFKILDDLEALAKEYDIRVVIHNHGLTSLYGNPAVLRNLIKHRDSRIGVCMDAGWIASGRLDPSKVFKEYDGRVYDIHLKDKHVESTNKGDVARDTFLGEGDANLGKLLQTLQETKWDGVIAIETDNNLKDPREHTVKALEFVKKSSK
ncbi:MAG TPA: sugar phosphate isomerase/epimerase [Verrucomicrobiae bacterium]|nr:sugar phosphate isomerase/epimerase [Verrucomicrobiae bacterium]